MTKRRASLLAPMLLEEATLAEQQRWRREQQTELEELIQDQDPEWKDKFIRLVTDVTTGPHIDKDRLKRTIYEAISQNIKTIAEMNKTGPNAVNEPKSATMSANVVQMLKDCCKDIRACKATLEEARIAEKVDEKLAYGVSARLEIIESRCAKKGMELLDWEAEFTEKAKQGMEEVRAAHEKTIGLLREQIRTWMRVAAMTGIELDAEFEDEAMRVVYDDEVETHEGAHDAEEEETY